MVTFREMVEYCNNRGVGQFHIFSKDMLWERITVRSFEIAKASADRHKAVVVNDSGDVVYRSK